ncbi:TPR domain-containing protein [Penicillium expansum]|nr:TPR domain-containing protein [Penicillium expansum]
MKNDQISAHMDTVGSSQYQPKNPTGDIDETVRLRFLALQAAVYPVLLENLRMPQNVQFQQARSSHDLDTAVRCFQLTAEATSYIDYAAHLNRLVGLFDSRFQKRDSQLFSQLHLPSDALKISCYAQSQLTTPMSDFLDEAFRHGFLALQAAIDPALLESLADQFNLRYTETQDIKDLNLAIEYSQLATKMTTYGHHDLKPRLELLAELLELRFRSTGYLPDLDGAIQFTYAAIIAPFPTTNDPTNDNLIPFWLNIGGRLGRRFGATGNFVDINDAIRYLVLASKEITEDSLFYVDVFCELAFTLNCRYEKSSDLGDLNCSISLRQRVYQSTVEQGKLWLDCLRALAGDLAVRYKLVGDIVDLHNGVEVAYTVADKVIVVSSDNHFHSVCFYELGAMLLLVYEADKNMIEYLDFAIDWSRRAAGASRAHREVVHLLERLLKLRYEETHQVNDSEEAARCGKSV